MSKTTTPQLRFKKFSDNWEVRPLKRLCSYCSSNLTVNNASNDGAYPLFDANSHIGYINDRHITVPYISIIKDGAGVGRTRILPKDSFIIGTLGALLPEKSVNIYFLNYVLFLQNLSRQNTGSTIPHIYFSIYGENNVFSPSSPEQEAIGTFFSRTDSLIEETEREIERLEKMKLASLQKMFPRPGASTPEIRFTGFTGEWKKCSLGELLTQRIEHQTISEEEPLLAFSYAEGVIDPKNKKSNKRDFLMTDKDNKIFSRTEIDDIIYNPANVIHGAIHRNALRTGVVSPIYKIFMCNTGVSPKYMGYRLRTTRFIREIEKFIEGTVIKLRTLSPESFLNMVIEIPEDLDEQKAIGEYFSNLDAFISAKREKLSKLRNIKQACLDKMFVNTSDL